MVLDDPSYKLVLFNLVFLFLVTVHGYEINHQGRFYFAIAASPSTQTYSKVFNRTLINITQSYLFSGRHNFTLETLIIELPENGSFSATLLRNICGQFDGKHVAAVLVIGDTPAAFTVSLTAKHAGIPVLWAKGKGGFLPGLRTLDASPMEVQLAPTGRELVQALRGLLLQAHWHTFTLLADSSSSTALRRPDIWTVLSAQPLRPHLVTLSSPLRAQSLFRKLADISRSTRGVVVLLSDRPSAIRILADAKRLNMMDGHFVWIWVDTATNISIKEEPVSEKEVKLSSEERYKREVSNSDDVIDVNYLLKNDQFLLFNRDFGESSKPPSNRERVKKRSSAVDTPSSKPSELPAGLLSLKPLPIRVDRHLVKGAVRLLLTTLRLVLDASPTWVVQSIARGELTTSCWKPVGKREANFSNIFGRELKIASGEALAGKKFNIQEIGVDKVDKSLVANFEILNLVPVPSTKENELFSTNNRSEHVEPNVSSTNVRWKRVGLVSGRSVRLDTIIWPGGDLSVAAVSSRGRTVFRIVTALAPPFVMEGELDEDGQCLRGLPCHRVLTSDKDNLTLVFTEMKRLEEEEADEEEEKGDNVEQFEYEENDRFFPFLKFRYRTNCCYGLSMDLLENIAQELEFDFRLYIVADSYFGARIPKHSRHKRDLSWFKRDYSQTSSERSDTVYDPKEYRWNGIVGDLVSGAAHMSFAALSVSSTRSEVIDFSTPYFFSGISLLAAPQQMSEIPLMAFLLPFSPELWIAIFTSLNITAVAVAIYEWLSPFGLNPWGRQRSKNFSMSSALWVMWGLLCGHLVAFKAPKSWPNKFLINVWGGFSVIFVASYTANIAALIAGLFFHNTVNNYRDRGLLNQRVGAARFTAAEYYVQKANRLLWQQMHKFSLESVEEGTKLLRNGSLDILIADTPILDYYRATDHGCKLQKVGDTIVEDTYAIGMTKGFPLKDSISAVIAKYSSNGYMDILQEKWYGGLPCFKLASEMTQPRPLGVAAVTGVFILLGVGIALGLLILLVEHLFFRYTLPILRDKPKGSIWRSRNIMFFSQKLYRFINCVELVSPHHAARELVHTIRQGQITSLFQKSIKRKEHEQRRRRKSKAQFFEMIQEIRSTIRRQQEEREAPLEPVTEVDSEYQTSPEERKSKLSPSILRRTFLRSSPRSDSSKVKSPTKMFNKQLFSPRSKNKARSSIALNVRRFSTDSVFNSPPTQMDHSAAVGRRLSKDAACFLSCSPPDMNSRRSSYLDTVSLGNKLSGKSPVLSIENVSDASSRSAEAPRKLSDSESIGRKLATLPKYRETVEKHRLQPQYSLTLGKSDEAISRADKMNQIVTPSKSFNDVHLTDEEIANRNRSTIDQLRTQISFKNPQIRIQVEDTSKTEPQIKHKRLNTRHQSLGDGNQGNESKKSKLSEQSKSLDGGSSSKPRKKKVEDLPPAPPPPNCSPRNSNGRSPLERLSKDELVLLWRSSESELRSHLLKAIRDKEEQPP